jgi:hypothetical protein
LLALKLFLYLLQMPMNPERANEPCVRCEELTKGWTAAAEQLSRSVGELAGKMGTIPKHQYDAMYHAAERARRIADEAENALRHHRTVHHAQRGTGVLSQ